MFESSENPKLAVIRDLYLRGILNVISEYRRTELINLYDREIELLSDQEKTDFFKLKGVKHILRIINKYRLIS